MRHMHLLTLDTESAGYPDIDGKTQQVLRVYTERVAADSRDPLNAPARQLIKDSQRAARG